MAIKRILFLATYFPDPVNSSRGNWALEQAQAFQRAGLEVRVVVPTPWIPGWAGKLSPKLAAYARVPRTHCFDGLQVDYPRWICYPWHIFNRLNQKHPHLLVSLGWLCLKPWFRRFLRSYRPDGVLAHHTLVAGQVARLLRKNFQIPYVVTDHEVGDIIAAGRIPSVRNVFAAVGSEALRMVMVSRQMERKAAAIFPSMRLDTVYNGSSFEPVLDRCHKPDGESLTIFCCAKFYGRKDIPLLLRAFDKVADKGYPIRLRIAGDGPDKAVILSTLQVLRHRDKVELLGLVSTRAVASEMRQADIFALVGWAEPFGVVFLEAMASALPVVVSRDAGVAEVLEDGRTALFTQPRDQASVEAALERLAGDASLRERLGEAARDVYMENFRWEQVIHHYLKMLEEGSNTVCNQVTER